jgi:integrase/recombinase XerD
MQFGVAVGEFLRFCALERQLSGHSVQAYAADLRDFRKWLKADVAIGDVSLASLKEYLEEMVGSRKLAVATVRRRFACLRAFFRRACEKHDLPDPFANWRPLLHRDYGDLHPCLRRSAAGNARACGCSWHAELGLFAVIGPLSGAQRGVFRYSP